MNKIKYLYLIIAATSATLFSVTVVSPVYAAISDELGEGACSAAGQTNCDPGAAANSLENTIANVINLLSIAVGIVAVIMIIFGGFRYITSAGNEQAIANAKRTILYAIIGLIIVVFAQVIVRFVLRETTSASIGGSSSQSAGSGGNPSGGGNSSGGVPGNNITQ